MSYCPTTVFATMPLQFHPVVSDWRARCITNGSVTGPSSGTLLAVHCFYENLITASLDTKFKTLNVIAPDDLTCSLTPLINSASAFNDPWTNKSFVASDLNINGLKSDGSKWLDTGLNPFNTFTTESSGITIVSKESGTAGTYYFDIGNRSGADTADWNFRTDWVGYLIWDYGNVGAGDRILLNLSNTRDTGYYSGNVVNKNYSAIYFASSSIAHYVVGTNTALIQGPPGNRNCFVFTANDGNVTPAYRSNRRYSFVALHLGLNVTESNNLFNAVQALRIALGGGSV